ncbi:DNA polymerase III subunit beta [Lysinibacillus sp. CNPSo 3705]|uniref:DNA polymerase III subunit beta n=1 Tax=Lysinibacillus sp. CNPSo 3705 TaxID=3028148 RepID=UPI002363B464|nr:DNA polymerase III subunit beta [Lysinibacillus sp. CNPSo 3705]MDD1505531.1 DNA polymerase III subunit beta [Lysinibacillus sp. CNPSo 3705]
MKFQITKSILDSVCAKFGRLLTGTVTIPILEGVLVEATENYIHFIVSNGDESMLERVPLSEDVNIEIPGRAVFPRTLFSITRKLKSGTIDFAQNGSGNSITVKQKKTKLDFQIMNAEEFPNIMTSQQPINQFQLPYSVFKSFIEDTVFAVATNESRPIIQGLKLEFTPSSDGSCLFSAIATDSHRLAQCQTKNYEANENTVVVIPAGSSLVHALKSFNGNTEIGIVCYNNQIALVSGNQKTIMYCRLLEGTYPATSRLIPETTGFFTVPTTELKDVVELIKTMKDSTKKDTVCKFEYNSGNLSISSIDPGGISKVQQELTLLDCQCEEVFNLSCNAGFLLDSLKTISTEKVMIKVAGPLRPFLIANVYEADTCLDERIQLVLPVRTY